MDLTILNAKETYLSDSDILILAQIEEHPAVRKWVSHAYGGSVEKMYEWFKKSLAEIPKSDNEFLVAKVRETVVGFAGINRFEGNMNHVGEVGVIVHPNHQNMGIGIALLKTCIKIAKKRGFERLEANTLAFNKPMMRIAQKAGFVVEGIRKRRFKKDSCYFDEALLAINFNKRIYNLSESVEMSEQRQYMHMKADLQDLLSRTRQIPDLIIREAYSGDSHILGKIYAHAYFELMDQLPPPRSETLEDFTNIMIESFIKTSKQKQKQAFGVNLNIFKWIAEYSKTPVGFIVTGITENYGYIGEIGVLPSYRRKGIAQALIHKLANFLREHEVQLVELDVNVQNISAIRFYLFCGFKKTHIWSSDQK